VTGDGRTVAGRARQDVELKIVRNNIFIDQGEDKLLQILTDMPVWHFGLSKEVQE